jgi:galactokinase
VDILGDMRGVIGARLTGGGFGGAAMALCNADFGEDEAQSVVTAFLERFPHHPPSVFSARAGQGARVVEGGK